MVDFSNIELLRKQIAELLDKALSAGDPQKAAEYVKQSTEILKLYNDALDQELKRIEDQKLKIEEIPIETVSKILAEHTEKKDK